MKKKRKIIASTLLLSLATLSFTSCKRVNTDPDISSETNQTENSSNIESEESKESSTTTGEESTTEDKTSEETTTEESTSKEETTTEEETGEETTTEEETTEENTTEESTTETETSSGDKEDVKEEYTVSFVTNCDTLLSDIKVEKNSVLTNIPSITKNGYKLEGWYLDSNYTNKFDVTMPIAGNITLYAKWIEETNTVEFVGTDYEVLEVKSGSKVTKPNDPVKEGYKFMGWYQDQLFTNVFDFDNTIINSNIKIYALFEKINTSDITDKSCGSGTVVSLGAIKINSVSGTSEAAYLTFDKYCDVTEYDYYLSYNNGEYKLLDEKSVYTRILNKTTCRADLFGLKSGSYTIKVVPHGVEGVNASIANLNVIAYDRSGYAHYNYNGVGAYNDDGTLKDNAIILYVTDENKNTVELTYNGTTVKGIGNILNSVGQDTGNGSASNGGKANTNQGILKKLGDAGIPLVVRFVGCVSNSGLYKKDDFSAASTPLIDGLTIYNSADNGGTEGDNGHMARMKSAKDVTIEGVGSDAVIDGFGFHFMCESSSPTLGKSFEVRNLTFINTPEDAIGMEGVQASKDASSTLTASVERCWIHNNEFYGPSILNPAESDKGEGDGSCDFKRGQYLTVSYNYFEGCHKTNLVGSADYSLQYNLTYHHNYWKLCKARGPLTRRANVHMYNNLFEGQTDYALNTRADAYIFSEYNMFYACKNPFRVDGGAIKSYGDSVASAIYQGTKATFVSSKSEIVSNNCSFISQKIDYSKFDTDSNLSYIPTNDYNLQTNVTDARKVIAAYTGVNKDEQVSANNVSMSDISYITSSNTITKISEEGASLTPGKISKTIYAFEITRPMTVSVTYGGSDYSTQGTLINEAGEAFIIGNGSTVLEAGRYIIQCNNFQPGDSKELSWLTFKDLTISSLVFNPYNSEEQDNKQIEEYNSYLAKITSPVEYNSDNYTNITKAMSLYNAMTDSAKAQVDQKRLIDLYNEYINAGKAYVEGLINAIGTVDENSGNSIASARLEYNKLLDIDSSVTISNLETLTSAEDAYNSYAVTNVIKAINEIGEVTLDSKDKILNARNLYDALSAEQKAQVTNEEVLTSAEKAYSNLISINDFNTELNGTDTESLESMKNILTKYNNLDDDVKEAVNTSKVNEVKVTYLTKLIDSIGKVTKTSGSVITECLNLYDSLSDEDKSLITNYETLTNAKAQYDEIQSQILVVSFENFKKGDTSVGDGFVTVTDGNPKTGVSKTYNGVTYDNALKIESSTSVEFTLAESKKVILVTDGLSKKIKIDGKAYQADSDGIVEITLEAGSHTVTKGNTMNLFALIFE